jgi:hypothetical protein
MRILQVPHPVPLRVVPSRGQRDRPVWSQATTQVELREADPAGFSAVAAMSSGRYYEHGGELWWLVEANSSGASQPDPLTPEDFAGILDRTGPAGAAPNRLVDRIAGTPLLAFTNKGVSRAEPYDMLTVRHVSEDGTARAASALRRMFEEDVRVAGDRVYMRAVAPMVRRRYPGSPTSLRPSLAETSDVRGFWVVRMDRHEDLWAFEEGCPSLRGTFREEHPRQLYASEFGAEPLDPSIIPSGFLRDDDVRLFGNAFPWLVSRAIRSRIDADFAGPRNDVLAALGPRFAGLEAEAAWSAIGCVADVEASLRAGIAVCRDYAALPGVRGNAAHRAEELLRFAETVVMPRIGHAAPIDEGDAAALIALLP